MIKTRCAMKEVILTMCMLFTACITLQRCDYPGAPSPGSSSSSTTPQAPGSPYVGGIAPAFSVKSANNETVDLNKLRGKVVLLAFFGTTG